MSIEVKICGLSSEEGVSAALAEGADLIGFNFYSPSPRAVSAARAAELGKDVAGRAIKVGLFVDADDDTISTCIETAALDMLQFHGSESPERVMAAKSKWGLPVMKVIKVEGTEDLTLAKSFVSAADRLLFDTKPPADLKNALPGGNALAFDWRLLAGTSWPLPWMLAGGLHAGNLAEAVAISGARSVDVSSGVERSPGVKDPAMIRSFLRVAKAL
jgi:phosphoribosylanthranilate isomerase